MVQKARENSTLLKTGMNMRRVAERRLFWSARKKPVMARQAAVEKRLKKKRDLILKVVNNWAMVR